MIPDVVRHLQASLAPSTRSLYATAWRRYTTFCANYRVAPLPINEQVLMLYVSLLARTVGYSTIRTYLAALQYCSSIRGHTFSIHGMQSLFYVLRGIRRSQGPSHSRALRPAITINHLNLIFTYISSNRAIHRSDKQLWRSVVTVAFFGLLRSSEYCCPSPSSFVASNALMVSNVTIINRQMAFIKIKVSKTDPFRTGGVVRLAAINSQVCPVKCLIQFLSVHPNYMTPLFTFHNGSFLTRSRLQAVLATALPRLQQVNTHSFRIGGASAAASAGIPDYIIQDLGRWRSDAFRRYLRLSNESLASYQSRMAGISHPVRYWNTISLTSCSL